MTLWQRIRLALSAAKFEAHLSHHAADAYQNGYERGHKMGFLDGKNAQIIRQRSTVRYGNKQSRRTSA